MIRNTRQPNQFGADHPLVGSGLWCRVHHYAGEHSGGFITSHHRRDRRSLAMKLSRKGEVYYPKCEPEIRTATLAELALI